MARRCTWSTPAGARADSGSPCPPRPFAPAPAAGRLDEALVAAAVVRRPGAAGHHVAVGVDRIDRIHQRYDAVRGEDLLDVRAVALAAVAHEYLVELEGDAARAEVVRGDLGSQELVADVRTVALQRLGSRLLPRRLLQGLDHHRR